ncbi:putative cell surface gpi-anchored protein [Botrytis fragariae]|uniref:Putative cell surface gpi-anchored protein n=1 Tax=Botrytis fragariae TaxID=1964551 RepID=A0A8H6AWF7_9HELO|nr:putative cell surface gpi-anchored protein [Botrytis fragariae]KAF5874989.1 putative cell surface gpi-anchored protein [Botrytis fragariae]
MVTCLTEPKEGSICSRFSFGVKDQAGASMVSACKYFPGRIYVADTDKNEHISFEGLEVAGSIEYQFWGPPFRSVSSSTLRFIANNLTIANVDIPNSWSFPRLESIHTLDLRNISSPLKIGFSEKVVVGHVNIDDVQFASGLLPNMDTVNSLRVISNPGLKLVDLSNTSHFHIQAPPSDFSLQVYSSAKSFLSGEIYGAAGVHMPAVEFCGRLTLASNHFSSYSALKLEYVQGNFEITGNDNLRSVSLPLLQRVAVLEYSASFYSSNNTPIGNSSLKVTGNRNLQNISMPALIHVDKDLEISGSKDLTHVNLTSLAEIRGRLAVMNGTFTKIPLPSLKILSPSLLGAMKNGTWNCSRIPSELGSIDTPGGSLGCLDFSPRTRYAPVLENIGSKHGSSSIFVAPSIIFGILVVICIIISVKNCMRSVFVFESTKPMSFNILSSHRTNIENMPELMTVERPVELSDPWQEIYELEATEYHELDSLPINPTSMETSYLVIQNLFLND